MAGTETAVEGLPSFRVSTLTAASSTAANSLEAGFQPSTLQNGAVAYVVSTDTEYRWMASSVAAASPPTVIIPLGQNPAVPGRWILIEVEPDGAGCVDFVIEDYASLEEQFPANESGVHNLDAGSYCVGNIVLPQGERLGLVADIMLRGMHGPTTTITGNHPSEMISTGRFVTTTLRDLIITNEDATPNDTSVVLSSTSLNLQLSHVQLLGPNGARGLIHNEADEESYVLLENTSIETPAARGIDIGGIENLLLRDTIVVAGAGHALNIEDFANKVEVFGGRLVGNSEAFTTSVTAEIGRVWIDGTDLIGSTAIDGNATMDRFAVLNSYGNAGAFIAWATANLPTSLLITNNFVQGAVFNSGFALSDAPVMARANMFNGSYTSERAIVP